MSSSSRIMGRPSRTRLAAAVALSLTAASPLVQAATFNVNSTLDEVDATPGNGQCRSTSNVCTLRAAIMEANALGGTHTINLPTGTYTLTLGGSGEDDAVTGDLDINVNLTITGASASDTIVQGEVEFGDRIFDIGPGSDPNSPLSLTVFFNRFTVRNGNAPGTFPDGNGGGIYVRDSDAYLDRMVVRDNSANEYGGGVDVDFGTLTITDSTVRDNLAGSGSGGIDNDGPLVITDSSITNNFAYGPGGGIGGYHSVEISNSSINDNATEENGSGADGGGIVAFHSLSMTGGEVRRNTVDGGNGGGIAIYMGEGGGFGGGAFAAGTVRPAALSEGYASIDNVTINDNDAYEVESDAFGGGVYVNNAAGVTSITNSRINNNYADIYGGGIFTITDLNIDRSTVRINVADNAGGGIYQDEGTLTITKSTIDGNDAQFGDGGGIYQRNFFFAEATLTNTTVSGNFAGDGSAGGLSIQGDGVTLVNVTVTGHPDGGIFDNTNASTALNSLIVSNSGGDCAGGLIGFDSGGNLDSDSSCGFGSTSATPNIGPLADNGGPTRTHALLDGSPAIDAGLNAGCPGDDQRGVVRPQGGACDIGAYEVDLTPPQDPDPDPPTFPPPFPEPRGPPPPPPPPPGPPNFGGSPPWVAPGDLDGGSSGEGMVSDGSGLTAVGFAFDGSAGLPAAGIQASGTIDLVVRRYNFSGQLQWSRDYDSGGNDYGYGIAEDGQNRITVAGYSEKGPVTSAIALQYDTAGNQQWLKTLESGLAAAYNIAAGSDGTLYVVGERHNGSNFDLLLVALNPDGSEKWRLVHDAGGDETGYGIALAPEGIYAVGARNHEKWGCLVGYAGAVQSCASGGSPGVIYQVAYDSVRKVLFLAGAIDQATTDAWAARFNPASGALDWVRIHDSGGEDLARGLALRNGFLFLTGRVFSPVDGANLFAVALDPDTGANGTPFLYDSGQFDSGHGIDLDAQGHVYVGGVSGDGFVVMQVPGGSP